MGIALVLALYAAAGTVIAVIGAVVFGLSAYLLTRRTSARRWRVVAACVIFPFACLLFAGTWFAGYAAINESVFHRDPGLGDGWETPLPNGYQLTMIDTTDQGSVYNPKFRDASGLAAGRPGSVSGVRELQVAQNLIYGARDTGYFSRIGQESKYVDRYFEVDTTQDAVTEFGSLAELRRRASSKGVELRLRDVAVVFEDYRTTWFDRVAGLVLLLVPIFGFACLVRWVWRVRSAAEPVG